MEDQSSIGKYQKGSLSASDLTMSAKQIWEHIRTDPSAPERLSALGIPTDRVNFDVDFPFWDTGLLVPTW